MLKNKYHLEKKIVFLVRSETFQSTLVSKRKALLFNIWSCHSVEKIIQSKKVTEKIFCEKRSASTPLGIESRTFPFNLFTVCFFTENVFKYIENSI